MSSVHHYEHQVNFGSERDPNLGISLVDLADRFLRPEQTLQAVGRATLHILEREAVSLAKHRRLGGYVTDTDVSMYLKIEVYDAELIFNMVFGQVESPQKAVEVERDLGRIQAPIASAALSILSRDVQPRRRLTLELTALT